MSAAPIPRPIHDVVEAVKLTESQEREAQIQALAEDIIQRTQRLKPSTRKRVLTELQRTAIEVDDGDTTGSGS